MVNAEILFVSYLSNTKALGLSLMTQAWGTYSSLTCFHTLGASCCISDAIAYTSLLVNRGRLAPSGLGNGDAKDTLEVVLVLN